MRTKESVTRETKSHNHVIKKESAFKIPKKTAARRTGQEESRDQDRNKPQSVCSLTRRLFKSDKILSRQEFVVLENSCRTRLYDLAYPIQQNTINNNEILEFIGDAYLQAMFAQWCSTTWPTNLLFQVDHGESILTSYKMEHLSTKPLAAACRRIGLADLVLTVSEEWSLIATVHEDVFEAWIAACVQTFGYDATYSVIKQVFFDHLDLKPNFVEAVSAKLRLNNIGPVSYRRDLFADEDGSLQQSRCWFAFLQQLTGFGTGQTVKESDDAAANDLWSKLMKLRPGDEMYSILDRAKPYWHAKLVSQPWKKFEEMSKISFSNQDVDERDSR